MAGEPKDFIKISYILFYIFKLFLSFNIFFFFNKKVYLLLKVVLNIFVSICILLIDIYNVDGLYKIICIKIAKQNFLSALCMKAFSDWIGTCRYLILFTNFYVFYVQYIILQKTDAFSRFFRYSNIRIYQNFFHIMIYVTVKVCEIAWVI